MGARSEAGEPAKPASLHAPHHASREACPHGECLHIVELSALTVTLTLTQGAYPDINLVPLVQRYPKVLLFSVQSLKDDAVKVGACRGTGVFRLRALYWN